MVYNARLTAELEGTPRPIVAFGNDYPDDFEISPHYHSRSQFLHAGSGVMTVRTEHGAWVVPPQEAMWIPAGIVHSVRMIGPVTTRSLYVRTDAAIDMPQTCQVLSISGLMRELLLAAVDLPADY